ncbi:hypothetical protein RAH42_09345 [Pyramidobacter sp. YE332]|nr:hypothetical protein [Pyramidobacter sp. YE332]WOL39346.1 hypothetical protein RAH42_09345 [Pyramidobacter sp. YE332]
MMGKFMQRSRPPAVRKAAALLLALALGEREALSAPGSTGSREES